MNRATPRHARASLPSAARAVLVAVSLAGCARPAGLIWDASGTARVFPPPPDRARLAWLGQLHGQADLRAAVSGWEALRRAVAGPEPMGELSAPTGVAVSPQERVFVADPPAGCVHLLDLRTRQYRALRSAGATPLVAPADVAIGDGRVFVSDAGRGVIDVFSESGDYQSTWPATLRRPAGVAWDAARQRLYVVDAAAHGCVGFSAAGVEQVRFGQRGVEPGQFNFPTFVACDARLGVIVTDSLNARVQRFSPEGQFIATFGKKGDAAGDFSLPKGVAADAAGHIYVADAHFENVQLFDDAGRLLLAFGSEGQGPGEFWLPAKLCFDGQSRLWVADSYNRRVQVFRLLDAAREPVS